MRILHLVADEKFIDFFAGVIGQVPDTSHQYVVYTPNPDKPLRYIRKLAPFRKVDNSYFFSAAMQSDLAWCDALLVHYMTPLGARMIRQAPAQVVIAWSGWGADYYHLLPGGENALLGPQTREIARRLRLKVATQHPINFGKWLLRSLQREYIQRTLLLPALKRIQVFSAPLPDDYDLLKSIRGKCFQALYRQINYGSVEQTFAVGGSAFCGRDILVGNSASLTNNHVEVFLKLARHDLSGCKVVVPLSYGDPSYRAAILEYGSKILGEHFDPVIDFLPLAEYNQRISRCSVVVMNHQRQQALGNIGTLLYLGAKLFLDERNVVYRFLQQRGAHVYSTGMLENGGNSLVCPLTNEQKRDNRRVLQDFWGQEMVNKNAVEFVTTLKILVHA